MEIRLPMKRLWFITLLVSLHLIGCQRSEIKEVLPPSRLPAVDSNDVALDVSIDSSLLQQRGVDSGDKQLPGVPESDAKAMKSADTGPAPEGVKDQAPGYRPKDALYAKLDSLNRERQRRHDSIRDANGGVTPPRKQK